MTPRIPCHVCGDPVAVRRDGCFRDHSRYAGSIYAIHCEGTGQRADDARLAARGKLCREADDARRSKVTAVADLAHTRAMIERLESQLPALEARAAAAVEALAAFDREHPAGDVRRAPVALPSDDGARS